MHSVSTPLAEEKNRKNSAGGEVPVRRICPRAPLRTRLYGENNNVGER